MKNFPALFAAFAIAFCFASPLKASTGPPAIDPSVLQAYAHGSSVISGKVGFEGGVAAYCAPNVPYVAWYLDRAKNPGAHPAYDPRMMAYTRVSRITKFRTFVCTGLSPGSYLVWAERFSPGFQGVADSRPLEDSLSGQMTPGYDTIHYTGGSSGNAVLFGPETVTIGAGTTNVSL